MSWESFKLSGYLADGYAPLGKPFFHEDSIRPMHQGPGVDTVALSCSSEEDEALSLLTYMLFFFCTASYLLLICIGQTSMAGMRWGCNVLNKAPSVGVWIAPGLCAWELQLKWTISSIPILNELDGTGMLVSSGPLPLQTGVNTLNLYNIAKG